MAQHDVGAVTGRAQRGDRAADRGKGLPVGGAVVQEEAVGPVPVEIPPGLGEQRAGPSAPEAGAVRGVEPAEDADTGVAQPAGRGQAVRVARGARSVGDVQDDPVQGGCPAG
ncbi:hypothetical protein GCM10010240_18730 [Streptomyces griseoviridis]|nr:hypothetical protein GCM10010240_18730 [Streptomyces griseoviridis]